MAKKYFIKQYSKDLELYRDFCKSLQDYRLSLFPYVSKEKFREYRQNDTRIIKRLAIRLNIKTLDMVG